MNTLSGREESEMPGPSKTDRVAEKNQSAENVEEKIQASENHFQGICAQLTKLRTGLGLSQSGIKAKVLGILPQNFDNLREQSFNMRKVNNARQALKNAPASVVAIKDRMKQINKENEKAKIDKIDDELADLIKLTSEIEEVMRRSYNTPDEDKLADELETLGNESAQDDDTNFLDEVKELPETPKDIPDSEK